MDAQTSRAVRKFLERVPKDIPYEKALLFGSRARGDYREDSDADVAFVVPTAQHEWSTLYRLGGIVGDVFADTGITIQPVLIPLREWREPDVAPHPAFVRNVAKDGVEL